MRLAKTDGTSYKMFLYENYCGPCLESANSASEKYVNLDKLKACNANPPFRENAGCTPARTASYYLLLDKSRLQNFNEEAASRLSLTVNAYYKELDGLEYDKRPSNCARFNLQKALWGSLEYTGWQKFIGRFHFGPSLFKGEC
jgi:hypothetical protein